MFLKTIKLSELAFACYLYARFTDYDSSYLRFLKETHGRPDLNVSEHRSALLEWLNKWGCRQFAKEAHDFASSEILSWFNEFKSILFSTHKNLLELTEDDYKNIYNAYKSLSNKKASNKIKCNKKNLDSVGPTGAAKILFAIRPK